MARRRSRTSATGGNLDSMLDTLTNVVGILVIVLVAVQLSSQEAASKIAEQLEKIDPQEMERLEQQAAEAKAAADAAADAVRQERQAVLDPRARVSQLETQLAVEQDLARDAAAKAVELERKREAERQAAQRATEQAVAERTKKEAEKNAAAERLAALKRELENLPVLQAPPAKEVRLPYPRPAPQGAKEFRVLCREGRIWLVDLEALQEKALKRADYVVRSKKLDPENDKWIADGQAFLDEFNRTPVKEGGFEMTLVAEGNRWPRLVLGRSKGGGDSADDAIKGTGDLARALRRLKPETHFVRFYVWPDSFEDYLKVREFAGQRGFAAGWEPMGSPDEHRIPLKGYYLGEKPPPSPSPPPGTKPPPPPNLVD